MGNGIIGIMFSLLGIGVSEAKHKSDIRKREEAYYDAQRYGHNKPYEYVAMCYYNRRSDELTDKYRCATHFKASYVECKKLAMFDLLGYFTEYEPQIIFARRLVWFKKYLPSNMSAAWINEQGKKEREGLAVPPEHCIRSSFAPFPKDHKKVNKYWYNKLIGVQSGSFTNDDFEDDHFDILIENDLADMSIYERPNLHLDYRKLKYMSAKHFDDIVNIIADIESQIEHEQTIYDGLPEYLWVTDRAKHMLDNVESLKRCVDILKGFDISSTDEEYIENTLESARCCFEKIDGLEWRSRCDDRAAMH